MSGPALALSAMTWFAPDAAPAAGVSAGGGPGVVLRGDAALPALRLAGRWASQASGLAVSATATGLASAEADVFATLGARWMVVDREAFHLAPFVSTAAHWGVSPLDTRLTARVGLAVEGGGDRVRGDASLYLTGLQFFPAPTVETRMSALSGLEGALPVELGARVLLGEHHSLRVGLLSIFPLISYRYEAAALYAELGLGSMGANSLALGRVGWRWG